MLADLGIDAGAADAGIIEVWNKIDLLAVDALDELRWTAKRAPRTPALVSAATGDGIADLLALIDRHLSADDEMINLVVPAADGAVLAWLHANAELVSRTTDDDGSTRATVRIERARHGRLLGRLKGTGVKFVAG